MIDIYQLPIPDWGLQCPKCRAPLAGMAEHQCAHCATGFDILDLLAAHRPIPDLGLKCPECGYLLTGLTGHRCPECGRIFSLRRIMLGPLNRYVAAVSATPAPLPDHHVKKREPEFTGRERPLPDFGLKCDECRSLLAGAKENACPTCGTPFDLAALVPRGDWIDIMGFLPPGTTMTEIVLYDAQIPYLLDDAALTDVYSLSQVLPKRLRVPREFFFDALHWLATAVADSAGAPANDWVCPACGNLVPANFDICWNCPADRNGPPSPESAGPNEA